MRSDGFSLRLSFFYAGLFLAAGIQLPFFPVWLESRGFDPARIGLVLTIPTLVRIAAVPVVTGLADGLGAVRGLIMGGSLATFAAAVALAFFDSPLATIVLVAALAFAFTPLTPLSDAYALHGLAQRRGAYGPVRLWGSVAFLGANLAGGFALDLLAPRDVIWVFVAAVAIMTAAAVSLRPVEWGERSAGQRASFLALLRSPAFLAVTCAASLVQASHALYYGFSVLDWAAKGLSGTSIGALWALGVGAEIALFWFSARMSARMARLLLVVGAIGALIRWLALAANPPAILLPIIQCLHALSFGATHLGAMQYLARAAPAGLAASAQGALTTVLAVAGAATMASSGLLFGEFGSGAYLAMAMLALAGLACAAWALRIEAREKLS